MDLPLAVIDALKASGSDTCINIRGIVNGEPNLSMVTGALLEKAGEGTSSDIGGSAEA